MRCSPTSVASRSAPYSVLLVLLWALIAGCGDGLGPENPSWSCSLSDTTGVELPLTATTQGGAGELQIRGPYATPCLTTKDRISFQGSLNGSDVQLRIVWSEPDGGCQTAVDEFSWMSVWHLGRVQGPGLFLYRMRTREAG